MIQKNIFFDINKLPPEEGLILFPISMSRVYTGQSPSKILEYILHFSPKKVSAPKIGLNFIYGDFLYLYSDEPAHILKAKFMNGISNHKNALQKLLFKHRVEFQIQHAFEYMLWGQLYLGSKDFINLFNKLLKIYTKDKTFQKYLKEDAKDAGKKYTKNNKLFFLEEHLLLYLISKKQVRLPNDYIQDREKWILFCYPGKPPKALVYLFQKNFFKLPKVQPYEGQYDLSSKQYIDFERVDLETF